MSRKSGKKKGDSRASAQPSIAAGPEDSGSRSSWTKITSNVPAWLALVISFATLVYGRCERTEDKRVAAQALEESRKTSRAADFHLTLSDLSSNEGARRVAGLHRAREYVGVDEYRPPMRSAVLVAVSEELRTFVDREVPDDRRLDEVVRVAGQALVASAECDHLQLSIEGLRDRLEAVGLGKDYRDRMPAASARRAAHVLQQMATLGSYPLLCAYLPACASSIDFRNIVDGDETVLAAGMLQNPAAHRPILKPDALSVLSGSKVIPFPYEEPKAPPVQAALEIRDDPLLDLLSACDPNSRKAIITRACEDPGVPGSLFVSGPLRGCRYLRTVEFLPGGLRRTPLPDPRRHTG